MCACRGANSTPSTTTGQERYEVSLPNGQTMTVSSEHDARVAITRAGGGTFSRK
jgi:hypothetical protein